MEPGDADLSQGAVRTRTDLEIIEQMIQAGGARAADFKMTPSETMKAMELKYKLTQGSAFEGMLDSLNRAAMEEDDLEPMPGDPAVANDPSLTPEEADIAFEVVEYSDDS
jgi:hypothetical protein